MSASADDVLGAHLRGSMTTEETARWAAKAQRLARPLLTLPHAPAAPAQVVLVRHEDSEDAPFGDWMLTWPESLSDQQVIHHLPDGTAFLTLLEQIYSPILQGRPTLRRLLSNRSRLEMSVTNDVLQVQLVPIEGHYCMIRHHSLMLFESILWLDQSNRVGWGELCTRVADMAMAQRRRPPSTTEFDDIEAAGFERMRQKGAVPKDPAALAEFVADPSMRPVADYLVWATVGIAVLWRDYNARQLPSEMLWHDLQLGSYQDEDYLTGNLWRWL